MSGQCCCRFGLSVGGELPEFGCTGCPVHKGGMFGDQQDVCRRHRSEGLTETSGEDRVEDMEEIESIENIKQERDRLEGKLSEVEDRLDAVEDVLDHWRDVPGVEGLVGDLERALNGPLELPVEPGTRFKAWRHLGRRGATYTFEVYMGREVMYFEYEDATVYSASEMSVFAEIEIEEV